MVEKANGDTKGGAETGDGAVDPQIIQVDLPAVLDLPASRKLIDQLKQKIGSPIELNAAHITQIATPGVEVLVSAAKQWHSDKIGFCITNLSEPLLVVLDILGLDVTLLNAEQPA